MKKTHKAGRPQESSHDKKKQKAGRAQEAVMKGGKKTNQKGGRP